MIKKKKSPTQKKEPRGKATTSSGQPKGVEKGQSVIARRNQNGTVMLMRMDQGGSFFKLDAIAAEVWACLELPRSLQALTAYFTQRYPARAKTLGREIDALVKELLKFKLLAEAKGTLHREFPAMKTRVEAATGFGTVQEFDLEQIESEVLNESVYLDVFAGSDLQLKTDVAPIRDALKKVVQLDGITHRWDRAKVPGGKKITHPRALHAGLIAQQVAMQMPELVRADARTGYLAVEYQKLGSYLVEAIKDLDRLVSAQEKRIKHLEKKRV